jgi:hypothetical protein
MHAVTVFTTDLCLHTCLAELHAQVRQNQRDTLWDSWTCVLGFPVMGIWQDYSDGTDINSVCRWRGWSSQAACLESC